MQTTVEDKVREEAGKDGLPLKRIVRNVFNITNSFFIQLNEEDVYSDVASYLRTNSKKAGAPVKKLDKRGWYGINYSSVQVQQLLFDFENQIEPNL